MMQTGMFNDFAHHIVSGNLMFQAIYCFRQLSTHESLGGGIEAYHLDYTERIMQTGMFHDFVFHCQTFDS